MMPALVLAATIVRLTIGIVTLTPADILDGRAIASGGGAPVVMLTLTPTAAVRIAKTASAAIVLLDDKPVVARLATNTIEIDGQPDFASATALALKLSGKPPLPDSTDE